MLFFLTACCDRKMVKLCVEPGLYEWLGWVRQEHPAFLHPSELHSFGIPVDQEYSPIFPMDQLDYDEDVKNYYKRNGHVAKCIVDKYDQHGTLQYLFVATSTYIFLFDLTEPILSQVVISFWSGMRVL